MDPAPLQNEALLKYSPPSFPVRVTRDMERNQENYVKKSIARVYNSHVKWSVLYPPFSVFCFLFITYGRLPFDFRLA